MGRNSKNNNNKDERWKVGEYVRLSREDGEDGDSQSILGQKRMLNDYVEQHEDEFNLINCYTDDGYSGTNFNRPSMIQMLDDIEKGIINCVIVKDLSRFGRDYITIGSYLEKYFPEHDVRFIALTDNIDSFKRDYDMLMPVKNVFNQQYALDISNKVQSSFKVKQHSGKFIGAFSSFGYLKNPNDHNKLIIDEYAAQIIRRIFKMYLDGMGQLKIARILNEEGILCPSEYKKQSGLNYKNCNRIITTNYWTYSTIHRILLNQIYCGDMVQNKTKRRMKGKAKYRPESEWIIVSNTHDAIIDGDTWDKVQNLVNRNTRQLDFSQNISIFAGFLLCSDCGRAMAKNIRGSKTYYICGSYKRYGTEVCSSHTIEYNKLEDMVIDYINVSIKQIINLQKIAQSQQKIKKGNTNVKKELEKNQISLDKIYVFKKGIYEDYKDGILTKDEYLQYKSDYDKDEKLYNDKVDTLTRQENEEVNDIFKNKWLIKLIKTKQIDKLDRSILADFIDHIEISNNKELTFVWNCPTELNELMDSLN